MGCQLLSEAQAVAKFIVYMPITGLQPKDHITSNPVPYRGNFSSLGAILSVSIARIPAILLYPSRKSVTEAIGMQVYMNIAQICGRPFTRSIGNIKKEPPYITEAGNHRVPLKENDQRDLGPLLGDFRSKSSDAIPRII